MKKAVFVSAALAGILLLGGVSVLAAEQINRSNAITEETARNSAYADAGVLPEEAEATRTEIDLENGKPVYEIEFTSGGNRYEYEVDSSNGNIIEKDSVTQKAEPPIEENHAAPISAEEAKDIALKKAGLSAENVIFSKAETDREDGRLIYDIEFCVSGQTEYDYEIDAYSGAVVAEEIEPWEADDD